MLGACAACAREDPVADAERVARELARAELVAFAPPSSSSDVELAWQLPDGWRERPVRGKEAAAFYVRGDARVRCALTLYVGDGGGLAELAALWRSDFGYVSAADVEALASVRFLERDARVVDLEGRGSPGKYAKALVALVASDPRGSAVFELAGPRELVLAERGSFLALARSLAVRSPAREASR